MPALPLETIEHVQMFEKFLSNDTQLADTVSDILFAQQYTEHCSNITAIL